MSDFEKKEIDPYYETVATKLDGWALSSATSAEERVRIQALQSLLGIKNFSGQFQTPAFQEQLNIIKKTAKTNLVPGSSPQIATVGIILLSDLGFAELASNVLDLVQEDDVDTHVFQAALLYWGNCGVNDKDTYDFIKNINPNDYSPVITPTIDWLMAKLPSESQLEENIIKQFNTFIDGLNKSPSGIAGSFEEYGFYN